MHALLASAGIELLSRHAAAAGMACCSCWHGMPQLLVWYAAAALSWHATVAGMLKAGTGMQKAGTGMLKARTGTVRSRDWHAESKDWHV